MNTYKQNVDIFAREIELPRDACLAINHCNLPAAVLASVAFQQHPTALLIDGVHELHAQLFSTLDGIDTATGRAQRFIDYMVVHFRLHRLEDAGLGTSERGKRINADYLHVLRGWLFDPNGQEAAVLKGWVESRFGLPPRYHKGSLREADNLRNYFAERSRGLLGTNALEAQLDLLYSYCQYELSRRQPAARHLTLYRGINRLEDFDILHRRDKNHAVILLNNINAFTRNRERADEFGDHLLVVDIPLVKLFYFSHLLPGRLSGEDECLVIGGAYDVHIAL